MRAAVYSVQGPAHDVLRVEEVADLLPGPGEVRVRLHVAGVNPTDWKSRSNPALPMNGPQQTPGQDGAGVIDAVGEGVDATRVGERVWVFHCARGRVHGSAAEYTVVPAVQAAPLPEGASYDVGAALGIPFITAYGCLYADGPIAGQTILVHGGAGAVGHAAIQLALRGGARVITTVSSDEKAGLARAAGATDIVNYRDPGAAERIRALAPEGVDRVIEVALTSNLELDLAVVKQHGVVMTYAAEAVDTTLPVRRLMNGNIVLRFAMVYGFTDAMIADAVCEITGLLADGALVPLPTHRFPLERIADAHDAVEAAAVGKVLVDIG